MALKISHPIHRLLCVLAPALAVALPAENGGGDGHGIAGHRFTGPLLGGIMIPPSGVPTEPITFYTGALTDSPQESALGLHLKDLITWPGTYTPPTMTSFASTDPTQTSIFPYDVPQMKFYSYSGANITKAFARTVPTTTAAIPTPAPAVDGHLDSLTQALNITIPTQHMSLLPTHAAEFQAAASSIVDLVAGRQMRRMPLELEVSPSHMHAVWNATKRLKNIKLEGTEKDLIEIYFAWSAFTDELVLPPRLPSNTRFSKDELQKYWHELYEAWYMARVRSAKIAISHKPKEENFTAGGAIVKQWGLLGSHWSIHGQHLNHVDKLPGRKHHTDSPGHGLHKSLKKCGIINPWSFQYGNDHILQCPEGYKPFGNHDPSKMTKAEKKKMKARMKKEKHEEKERKKHPDRYRPKEPTLADLGEDIEATEPLPPEQDDDNMTWWTNVGHSGCRPDSEQAAGPYDYAREWGKAISHPAKTCYKPVDTSDENSSPWCDDPPTEPQHNIVTRNGVDYLHINYYAWMRNAGTRTKQLLADRHRKDSGAFVANFKIFPGEGVAHCIKSKLHEMGWKGHIDVTNKTNWVALTCQ